MTTLTLYELLAVAEKARELEQMIAGHQYGLRGFGDGSLSRGRNLTDDEVQTIRTALRCLGWPVPSEA